MKDDFGGILGSNPTTNPDFHTFNAVAVAYCDGASFGGARAEPIATRYMKRGRVATARMYLRGREVFDAVVRDLLETQGLRSATEVILAGSSAGGLAVLYSVDHLAEMLVGAPRLVGLPDSGLFLDAYDVRQSFIAADEVWNVTGGKGTDATCLASQPAGEAWRCLLAEYLVPHITTPLFVINSAYDAYQLSDIAGSDCVPTRPNPCNASVALAYGDCLRAAAAAIGRIRRNGVYMTSCFVHGMVVNYCSGQRTPACVGWNPLESGSRKWNYTIEVDGRTPAQAFGDWYYGRRGARVSIDHAEFQSRRSCRLHQGWDHT